SRRRHTRFSRDWSSDVCSSDLANGDPVVAEVAVAGTTQAASTDETGEFILPLPAGEWDLQVTAFGYASQDHHVTVTANGDTRLRSEERRVGKEGKSRWRAREHK